MIILFSSSFVLTIPKEWRVHAWISGKKLRRSILSTSLPAIRGKVGSRKPGHFLWIARNVLLVLPSSSVLDGLWFDERVWQVLFLILSTIKLPKSHLHIRFIFFSREYQKNYETENQKSVYVYTSCICVGVRARCDTKSIF